MAEDVFNASWTHGNRPLVLKWANTERGTWMMIRIPAGMTYAEFYDKGEAVADYVKGEVEITRVGERITIEISRGQLQRFYPYEWEPDKYKKMFLPVPLGMSAMGPVVRDLAAGHLLVAGNTGNGKSTLIHVLCRALLEARARGVQVVIIDLKVMEYAYLEKYARVATDIDGARDVLNAVTREMRRRYKILRKAGNVKLENYRGELPFIVLIIDELAELRDTECQKLLKSILALGRAPGVRVIAATQRPSSTIYEKQSFGDSKNLFAGSVCFKVRDETNSRIVLDNGRAAFLPDIPGRAVYQWDRELEMQCLYLDPEKADLSHIGEVKLFADKRNRGGPRQEDTA